MDNNSVQSNIDAMAEEFEKQLGLQEEVSTPDGIPTTEDLMNQGKTIYSGGNEVRNSIAKEINLEPHTNNTSNIESSIYTETNKKSLEEVKTPYNTETKIEKEEVKTPLMSSEVNRNQSKINPEDFLKNLKVDLNNIDVVEPNPINKVKNFNFLMNRKSKTQIVAVQSGYVAYVEGLTYDDINGLLNSSLDDYGSQLLLCQTVYNAINTTSAGKLSFEQWKENTSYYDLESYLYGIYLETFPGTTDFTIKCGHCGKEINAKVNNDTLISADNTETTNMVGTILSNKNDSKTTMSNAIIHTSKKLFLEDSKLIVKFKLPTIKKHLDLLASINAKAKDHNKHILTFLLFVDNVYMLDLEQSLASGSPKYNEVIDRNEMVNLFKKLTYNDAKMLSDGINEMIRRYQVQFKVKSFTCSACGEPIGDIPVDMETLLFFRITQ